MMRSSLNQNGQALIAVLMIAVLLGVVGVQLVSLYETLHREDKALRTHVDAANFANYVQNVLSQPNLCGGALRDQNSQPIQWLKLSPAAQQNVPVFSGGKPDVQAATVAQIVVRGNAVASIGKIFSPASTLGYRSATNVPGAFQIFDMYVRRSYVNVDSYYRDDGTTSIGTSANPPIYKTVTSKLVIQLSYCSQMDKSTCDPNWNVRALETYRSSHPRGTTLNSTVQTIDVTLAVTSDSTHSIVGCYQPTQHQNDGLTCGPSNVYGGADCTSPAPPNCTNLYLVEGFDGFSKAICVCKTVCGAYFEGPTGTHACHKPPGEDGRIQDEVINQRVTVNSFGRFGVGSAGETPCSQAHTGDAVVVGHVSGQK